jgi:hypothetical protein
LAAGLSPISTQPAFARPDVCSCNGDVSGDGKIDAKDIPPFIAAYLGVAPNICADLAAPSGSIPDDNDLAQFVSMLLSGANCGLPIGSCCVLPPLSLVGNCTLETQSYCENSLGGRWKLNGTCVGGLCIQNDDCADAILITTGPIYTGSTVNGTTDGPPQVCEEVCGGRCNTAPDVWYKWVANQNGQTTFDMCEFCRDPQYILYRYDSIMSIYNNCPSAGGTQVVGGCNDDGCSCVSSSTVSKVIYGSTQAGSTYWIRISGWAGSSGNFTLRVNQP